MNKRNKFSSLSFELVTIWLLFTGCCWGQMNHQISPTEIGQALGENLKHPYLYFSSKSVSILQDRVTNNPKYSTVYDELLAETNFYLHMPVEKNAPIPDKNPRYTGNWDYHKYIDNNRKRAVKLAFLYQMTGEAKYAEKAFEFAEVVCDVPNWEDRAHMFPTIYSRVMPWNVPDDQVVFNFDLYAAHTAHGLAMVYDWIYNWMNVRQRDRIRGALLEKAILRVRGNWDFLWWASAERCNWLTHCASGVGMASLALLTEDPQLTDVISESYNRIWRAYDNIGQDGGWQEGTGYAFNNIEWAILYGEPLKRLTNNKYSLLDHPRIQKEGVSFFLWSLLPPDQKVNFGDTSNRITRNSAIFNALADQTKSPEAAWYANKINNLSKHNFWDIIFPETTVKPVQPVIKSRHFRSIDYVVMRSSFTDLETVTLVTKAGRHTDPHHGHLDCGDWGVHWRGESYIRGIGNIPYDEKSFDDARWTYPQAGSQGQNVIFVNGEEQIPGKWRGEPMDEGIGGDVLEYNYSDTREYVLMDGTNAYPKKELKLWRRHLILDKPLVSVVLDEIECAKGALIENRIHPIGAIEISDDHDFLLLKGEKGMMALIIITNDTFNYVQGNHAYLPLQKSAKLNKIPYVDAELITSGEKTTMLTIVVPVETPLEAKAISQSVTRKIGKDGALNFSFLVKNKNHNYHFKSTSLGLVLNTN
ncbi:heparinase II/III family protein [Tamlana agarivorans]|uniref:Heparinase II/III family protein n=1 Tax=Pseudotamlana agarivorans TaxID=481183 RepID=A0ACC5U9F8_9FLAO|nr:heparinase II/III family protein [Tamlana agarivorans]MBU2950942.1 heparinase II/III family protein [Tamlana agarivorans]